MSKFQLSILLFLGGEAILWFLQMPLSVMFIALLAYGIFIMAMAMCMPCNFFVKSIHKTNSKNVMLSFDDGPHPETTPQILDILKKHNAQAAFFLIGQRAQNHPDIVKKIAIEGHLLGSHSYAHKPSLGWMSTQNATAEIERGHAAILKIVPDAGNFFRPPFGVTNPNMANAIRTLNLQSVGWSVRSFDTVIRKTSRLKKRIFNRVKGGDIILFHDTQPQTVHLLDALLTHLKQQNLTCKVELS